MNFLIAAADASNASGILALGGFLIVALMGVSIVIALVWIIFPFIVHNHLRKIRGLQEDANYYLRRMASEVVAANAAAAKEKQ